MEAIARLGGAETPHYWSGVVYSVGSRSNQSFMSTKSKPGCHFCGGGTCPLSDGKIRQPFISKIKSLFLSPVEQEKKTEHGEDFDILRRFIHLQLVSMRVDRNPEF